MDQTTAIVPQTWNSLLSASERAALEREGWLCLPGVLGMGELEAMHTTWEARMALAPSDRGENSGPDHLEHEPAFAPCLVHPRVMAAIATLLDGDVRFVSLHGREPPRGHGLQGLHTDYPRPVEPDEQLLANAFWALDDMDAANGATRIVPGSHRLRQLPRGAWAQPLGRHPQERVLAARAGDVIVFSAHLWHAGTSNGTGARRRLAIAQFCRRRAAQAFQAAT